MTATDALNMQEKKAAGKPLSLGGKRGIILIYAVVYAAAACLLLYNLSDRLLWGDEAETALLGRNILQFGIPKIDDGKNVISQYPEPWEANKDGVWTWNTWLPYYIAALSFKTFGQNTFSARLPFALLGLLAVILMRKAARGLFEDEETALISTALLAFSVPFLLHARQCRYFSLNALGTIWLIIGYSQLLYKYQRRGGIHIALALCLLFYSSFISFVGNSLGIGLHALLISRKRREALLKIIPPFAVAAILILPWALYSGMFGKGNSVKLSGMGAVFLQYIFRMNFHIFPLILLALPPLALIMRKVPIKQWRPGEKTLLILLIIAANFLSLAIFPFVYFRYLVTMMPALFLLEARILQQFVPARALRYLLLFILIGTNIPGIVSLYPIRGARTFGSPIAEFVAGVTQNYEDKFENVLAFLMANASESESVAMMDPGYPLMFYTRMKMIDARYPRNRDNIWKADWVLSESPSGVIDYGAGSLLQVPESLEDAYQPYTLMVRDTPLGASRPDPDLHRFFSSDRLRPFIIYRRYD